MWNRIGKGMSFSRADKRFAQNTAITGLQGQFPLCTLWRLWLSRFAGATWILLNWRGL